MCHLPHGGSIWELSFLIDFYPMQNINHDQQGSPRSSSQSMEENGTSENKKNKDDYHIDFFKIRHSGL